MFIKSEERAFIRVHIVGPKGRWSEGLFACITMDVQLNGQINPDVQIFTVKLATTFCGKFSKIHLVGLVQIHI